MSCCVSTDSQFLIKAPYAQLREACGRLSAHAFIQLRSREFSMLLMLLLTLSLSHFCSILLPRLVASAPLEVVALAPIYLYPGGCLAPLEVVALAPKDTLKLS